MATNEELLREWQGGNAGALTTLVQHQHAPLVAHLYRLLGDARQAEDLAQDTFFRLVRNARSYDYPQPFLPWFYRIARNLALNYQQSAYHRYVDREADLPETLMDDADPQAWVERQERQAGLIAILDDKIYLLISRSSGAESIYALSLDDGHQLWQYDFPFMTLATAAGS